MPWWRWGAFVLIPGFESVRTDTTQPRFPWTRLDDRRGRSPSWGTSSRIHSNGQDKEIGASSAGGFPHSSFLEGVPFNFPSVGTTLVRSYIDDVTDWYVDRSASEGRARSDTFKDQTEGRQTNGVDDGQTAAQEPPSGQEWPAAVHSVGDTYTNLGILGMGGYGQVYKAAHRETGQVVAIKLLIRKSKDKAVRYLTFMGAREESDTRDLLRASAECKLMQALQRFKEHDLNGAATIPVCIEDRVLPNLGTGNPCYLVLELGGKSLDKPPHGMQRAMVYSIMVQLVMGIRFLQSFQHVPDHFSIIHHDLKPSNLLYRETSDGAIMLKIIDYGAALEATAEGMNQRFVKSPKFAPPESLKAHPFAYREPWYSYDMFSAGRIFFALLCPHVKLIAGPKPLEMASCPELDIHEMELIEAMTSATMKDRPSPTQVLELPWLKPYVPADDNPKMPAYPPINDHRTPHDAMIGLQDLTMVFDGKGSMDHHKCCCDAGSQWTCQLVNLLDQRPAIKRCVKKRYGLLGSAWASCSCLLGEGWASYRMLETKQCVVAGANHSQALPLVDDHSKSFPATVV